MNCKKNQLYDWCETHFSEHLSLLKTLAAIPSPSHHEEKRAEFIKNWLLANGAENVIVDCAKNVILPMKDIHEKMLVCMAHTDVVFPDTDSFSVKEEGGKLYAPGIGDDTANVVALMLCAKYFITHPETVTEPLLIVFNSCEEGLGNLKGVRQIMQDYAGQIRELVSFDCCWNSVVSRAVGSERWEVCVSTRGGHSFSDFGNPNAIVHLSRLIDRLYSQDIPMCHDSKTTYNVGLVSGGTSVNTIAQTAQMAYEYRSDDRSCLSMMEKQFHAIVSDCDCPEAEFKVTSLGLRPCSGDVPKEPHQKLLNRCINAISTVTDTVPDLCAASTDANIPLSLGIPAATFGLYQGRGAHTREEYVEISSLTTGLKIALTFLLWDSLNN